MTLQWQSHAIASMMAATQAGSLDQMYAPMMMPHHQAAMGMSRIAIRDIKDPELRRIAERTASGNEKSFEELWVWQQKHH